MFIMRSLEVLLNQYPEKTAREILEIQEQDKRIDDVKQSERDKEALEFIEDANKNDMCYKSTFGKNQYRFDRFFDFVLDSSGWIMCSVESVVAFYGDDFHAEITNREYVRFDKYSPQEKDKRSKKDFVNVRNYLQKAIPKFWGLIDQSKFE